MKYAILETNQAQLEKDEPALYETYKELMCLYYICLGLYPSRGNVNSLKCWVEYLFPVMDDPLKNLEAPIFDKNIAKAMKAGNHEDVVLKEEDGEYERGDVFLSFLRRLQNGSPGKYCWLATCQPS